MLYKIKEDAEVFSNLEPVEFKDFSSFGKLEKDLENLIANCILDVLFEDAKLMPVFQERPWQEEADIYALNESGELVIFELKRASAGKGAVHQALRYAEDAGQWSYQKLAEKFEKYSDSSQSLVQAHKEAFSLEHELAPKEINTKQHLLVIGSAADEALISSVDYWKNKGISIDFLPYRVYELAGEKYFEFFALPYDKHKNPGDIKGVLFDTNLSCDESSLWSMLENSRIEAYGDAKRFVHQVHVGDIVFFSHKGFGLVAAAKVKGEIKAPDSETLSRDIEFLTPIPNREDDNLLAMPFSQVCSTTGKSFYWARTIKVPYLSKNEAMDLVSKLEEHLRRN